MLSFSHPGYLWLLLGVLVPVALHLLSLRQLRVVVFPSVRFLRVSRQPQEGRRRLRDLLLLLVRVLLVVCVVLLLSGMRWIPSSEPSGLSGSTHVFFLDASASMSTESRWSQGGAAVRSGITERPRDFLGLVVSDGRELLEIPPTREHWRLTEALEGAVVSNYVGAPGPGLKLAVQWLSSVSEGSLEIISDFQDSDWNQALHVVPSRVSLTFHDVKVGEMQGNCGILGVSSQRLATGKRRVMVDVQSSHDAVMDQSLTVQLGSERQVQALKLAPGSRVRKVFLFDSQEDVLNGSAQLGDDAYPKDNRWVFWGDSTPVHRLVILSDLLGGKESEGSSMFLQLALKEQVPSLGCSFQPLSIDLTELTPEHLKDCQGVMILGCAASLEDWVLSEVGKLMERGGVLLVTPGKSPSGDLERLRTLGLSWGSFQGLRQVAHGDLPEGVGKVAKDCVLFPLFQEPDKSDLYMFAIQRCVRLRPQANSQVLIRSLTGLPLLLEQTLNKGRAFLLTFGLTPYWSNFPVTNSFLPLIRELMSSSLKTLTNRHRVYCGAEIFGPDGVPLDTVEPAISVTDTGTYEINVDPREGRRHYVSQLELRDLLTVREDNPSATLSQGGRDPNFLTPLLTALLLLLLMLELFICTRCDWVAANRKRG